jgi:hypothetical protein
MSDYWRQFILIGLLIVGATPTRDAHAAPKRAPLERFQLWLIHNDAKNAVMSFSPWGRIQAERLSAATPHLISPAAAEVTYDSRNTYVLWPGLGVTMRARFLGWPMAFSLGAAFSPFARSMVSGSDTIKAMGYKGSLDWDWDVFHPVYLRVGAQIFSLSGDASTKVSGESLNIALGIRI